MPHTGPVEVKDVNMPMIDDQVEAEEGLPRASFPPSAKSPPPKTVREAYVRVRATKTAAEVCAAVVILFALLCGTLCMVALVAVLSLLHLFLLIIGAMNVHNCPAEPYIPIYLIVVGAVAIFRGLLNYYYRWCHPKVTKSSQENPASVPSPYSNIINLFLTAWFVCGAVWVLRTHPEFDDANNPYYCDKLTYYTAYYYVIFSLVALALIWTICCCVCGCVICGALCGDANAVPLRAVPESGGGIEAAV